MNDAIGIMWVPEDLSNDRFNCTFSQHYFLTGIYPDAAEPKKWVLTVRHKADDYSLLQRWIIYCSNVQLYMQYYNENWEIVNVKFRNVRPMSFDINIGKLAIVFDECKVIPFLPFDLPYVAFPTPGFIQDNRLIGGHRYNVYR